MMEIIMLIVLVLIYSELLDINKNTKRKL